MQIQILRKKKWKVISSIVQKEFANICLHSEPHVLVYNKLALVNIITRAVCLKTLKAWLLHLFGGL